MPVKTPRVMHIIYTIVCVVIEKLYGLMLVEVVLLNPQYVADHIMFVMIKYSLSAVTVSGEPRKVFIEGKVNLFEMGITLWQMFFSIYMHNYCELGTH